MSFLQFCTDNNVYEKPEQVKLPTPKGPAVQLIAATVTGYACNMSTSCNYAVKDLSTMQRHCRETHKSSPLLEARFHTCQVQQLFTGVGNAYFEVDQSLGTIHMPDLRDVLESSFLPTLQSAIVPPANTERERTPLLRLTGWDTWMHHLRSDPKQKAAANDIKSKHMQEEHGGIFTRLTEAVSDHFKKSSSILDGHPDKLTLAKILMDGRNVTRDR
jgi:hypothetical protein